MSTPPDIRIRRLVPADADAFRTLRLEALTTAPEAFGSSPEEEAARPMDLVRSRLDAALPDAVFGAFAGDDLVGIAGFALSQGIKKRHKGLLWGVFVRAGWRDRGTGAQLVRAVIDHACNHVLLLQASVVTTNGSARRVYDRLGFILYGIERRALRVADAFHDEALLVLNLASTER